MNKNEKHLSVEDIVDYARIVQAVELIVRRMKEYTEEQTYRRLFSTVYGDKKAFLAMVQNHIITCPKCFLAVSRFIRRLKEEREKLVEEGIVEKI